MSWDLAIISLTVLIVASVSRRLDGTIVTPAMAFMTIGLVAGPLVVGRLEIAPNGDTVRTLAEATLAIVLFSDASRLRFGALRREAAVPARLLGIGLPLTIIAGALVGAVVFPSLTFPEALVLAVVLAPTDAALGSAVVTEPRLPSRIRQGLNVESGLNDGICVPVLLIVLAAADVESHVTGGHSAARIVLEEIGGGLIGGLIAGTLSAAILSRARRRDLIEEPWLQIIPVATAGLAYGLADPLHGSGFIAAFVAGGLFGRLGGEDADKSGLMSEELGDLLGGVTFLVFGAVLLGPLLQHVTASIVVYAVLSLTVVRMAPVAISMIGSHARAPTVSFLGWFGPRGLASIVFAVIVVDESKLPGADTIVLTTYVTIGLSVVAHGLSAAPLAARYAHWFDTHPKAEMERTPTTVTRPRGVTSRQPGREDLARATTIRHDEEPPSANGPP